MLRLVGAALLLTGTAGFSCCLCNERKRKLFYIKEIQHMFRLFQTEISYLGVPMPEVLMRISGRLAPVLGGRAAAHCGGHGAGEGRKP